MAKIENFPGPGDKKDRAGSQFPFRRSGDKRADASNSPQTAADAIEELTARRSADEIFKNVEANAEDELKRSTRALAFSGLAGGLTMGLTGLAVATARATLGEGRVHEFVSLLFYPLGFMAVIIGRAQLFTENTLYPVALILSQRKHVLNTMRLWAVVFIFNVLGAALFATVAIKTSALHPEVADALVKLGIRASEGHFTSIFWSGVIGGWVIALMAWIVSASQWTIGQLVVVWSLTVVVGIGHFAHCIASSGEIMSAVLSGFIAPATFAWWLMAATLGNILGGVVFVTVINFGQTE